MMRVEIICLIVQPGPLMLLQKEQPIRHIMPVLKGIFIQLISCRTSERQMERPIRQLTVGEQ